MSRLIFRGVFLFVAAVLLLAAVPVTWGQQVQGRVNITVLDPQGNVVPAAKLELRDLATAEVRTGQSQSGGTFSFVNLPPGKYKLTVTQEGFKQAAYDVTVQATKATDVEANLTLGAVSEVIEVGSVAPVVETTTNAIGTVMDMKQIENLPIIGRDITQLARLSPGYAGVVGTNTGTWNGLPSIAQGNNIDGVIASPSRMKFGGNAQASVVPRLENIEEMTVSTDQLDVNQGFGTSSMQLNYVTRRGGSDYHGRLYWDHRNSTINANSWSNNATGLAKPFRLRNELGGSVGGPVWPTSGWKEKLFFFFSLSTVRQPGSAPRSSTFLTQAAQAGNFTYAGGTVNLFTLAQNYNTANGTTLPTTVNTVIAGELNRINQSLSFGTVSTVDPIVNSINWVDPQPTTEWYPTFRIDYNVTQSVRVNFSFNKTQQTQDRVNQAYFPGSDFASTGGGNSFRNNSSALGVEWTLSPTLINSFRAGVLAFNQQFVFDSPREYLTNPVSVGWPLVRTTMNFNLPVTTYYPVISASDTLTWQKASHQMNFGWSFYRETNRYFNPPEGIAFLNLSLVNGDPALNAITQANLPGGTPTDEARARDLYALLAGRVTFGNPTIRYPVNGSTGQYDTTPGGAFNLKERATAWGLYYQDAWRFRSSLTFNYGVRLDFTGDARDLNAAYHNADESSLYGPSGIGNLFMPGTLTGNTNPTLETRKHAYKGWSTWQPNLGVAWAPRFQDGIMAKLFGGDATVIRASASLRSFTVPYQYFWNNASNYGSFFYQFGNIQPTCTVAPCAAGTYIPGSVSLGQAIPPYLTLPASYQDVSPASQFTFNNGQFGNGINGFARGIGQPYTLSWTVGIQRRLGASRALEVRYSANSTKNQWISYNLNEVNIFENGFLQEFSNARSNMAICQANSAACLAAQGAAGIAAGQQTANNFANWGLAGQVALPILTGAFTGSTTGPQTNSNFRGSGTSFITQLNTGQAGAMANTLSGNSATPYFCNLVGASFGPCLTNAGYTGAGAGFPSNFFQANPFGARIPVTMMNDDGYSNYNSLQIDFRQQLWHGLQFDANYTWSHTLGVSTPNDWTGSFTQFTLRNLRHSYGPTLFDLRHATHVSATYDLPFGKGKRFANTSNGVLDRIVGGWNVGTIVTYQTGFPFRLTTGYTTFNNLADSGILNGVTRSQLQNAVGVFRFPNTPRVSLINPQLLTTTTNASGQTVFTSADLSVLTPNTTPGQFAPPLFLHGPNGFYDDISISKSIAITERWRFSLQTLLINAFNHPVFGQAQGTGMATTNVRNSNFGTVNNASNMTTGTSEGFGRRIEFRLNINF